MALPRNAAALCCANVMNPVKKITRILLLTLLMLPWAMAMSAPDGYSINSDSDTADTDNLFKIDLATGNLTKIGKVVALGQTRIDVEGLAFAPDGELYGVDESTMTLFPIDLQTGAVVYQREQDLVGVSKGPGNDFGMTFACDEKLYLTSVLNDTLFTLNLDGSAQVIGNAGSLGANISAIAAFGNPVRLYGLGNGLDGDNNVDSRTLYEIDITTGIATPIGNGIGNAAAPYKEAGLAFDEDGVLWAITDRRNVADGTHPSQILKPRHRQRQGHPGCRDRGGRFRKPRHFGSKGLRHQGRAAGRKRCGCRGAREVFGSKAVHGRQRSIQCDPGAGLQHRTDSGPHQDHQGEGRAPEESTNSASF